MDKKYALRNSELNERNSMTYLITGGTGSFGKAFTRFILDNEPDSVIRIFSRDELKQAEMEDEFGRDIRLRFLLGDVRDASRLKLACRDVDILIHAAALKRVDLAEYNPMEVTNTNILGTQNVISAALAENLQKVMLISTDKAVDPINLYGATKLVAEKLIIQANNFARRGKPIFSVVRYGNVVGSRGSVVPLFKRQATTGTVTITDIYMTRFCITLPQACSFVYHCLKNSSGGEIFVPMLPSVTIHELARFIAPMAKIEVIGRRPGEKLHEVLISESESNRTYAIAGGYIIAPETLRDWKAPVGSGYMDSMKGCVYSSNSSPIGFLDTEGIRRMVNE